VKRSAPVSSRETQKKALVGVLVCVLALAAAVALVAPDGRGIRIHGSAARHSVSQRVAMSGELPPQNEGEGRGERQGGGGGASLTWEIALVLIKLLVCL